MAGTWTFLVFDDSPATPYHGPLQYSITGASFVTVANAVAPTERVIAPGASAPFSIIVTTPPSAGDNAESVVFGAPSNGDPPFASIPVGLRAMVPVHNSIPATFSGTLTGGVGRGEATQQRTFQFDVPPNMAAINVTVTLGADGYHVDPVLVDPNQFAADVQSTEFFNFNTLQGTQTRHASMTVGKPMAGRWTLILQQLGDNSSVLTSVGFTGTVDFNAPQVSATGVPTGKLVRGQPVTATVQITNTGNSAEAYSIDPRLNQVGQIALDSGDPTSNQPLPANSFPQFFVPPFTTRLDTAATSTVPIGLTTAWFLGFPQFVATSQSSTAVVTTVAPDLSAGSWGCVPNEIGPFPTGATNTTYSCGAAATTNLFDRAVTSTTGNVWSSLDGPDSPSFHPMVLQPGQSGSITVTFTPQGASGSTISGFLEVEAFSFITVGTDTIKAFPYTYQIQ
jgi:hypothetical protein